MSKILFEKATIVSLDPNMKPYFQGDILVDNDCIKQVRSQIVDNEAQRIDCENWILFPGFINAHQHTWQTPIRGTAGDLSILQYLSQIHGTLAPHFTPRAVYLGNLVGALNQISHGTTSLVDWCHNNPTSDHTNKAIEGLIESKIRSFFMHGSPKPNAKAGQVDFSEISQSREEILRLMSSYFSPSGNNLLTLGLAILGPHYSTLNVSLKDFQLAKEFALTASMHVGGGLPKTVGGWEILAKEGLLSTKTNIVHGNNLSDEELKLLISNGVSFTVIPEAETSMGHGWPITGRLLAQGCAPSLGGDVESGFSGDMFTAMRMALIIQRGLDHEVARKETKLPLQNLKVSCLDALKWATLEGAKMLGVENKLGSLTPGKQADIVFLRKKDLNLWPVHDPIQTIVLQATGVHVDAVMIAGHFVKKDGKLTYGKIDNLLDEIQQEGRIIKQT